MAVANELPSLNEPGEWAGLWWLPGEADNKVPGVLRYDPERGLELSLIGTFEDRIFSQPSPGLTVFHEGRQRWGVIHGAAESREVSLLDCIPINTGRTFGARVESPDKQIIAPQLAVIGAYVTGADHAAFSAVEISVEELGLWASLPGLKATIGAPDGKPDGSGSISADPPESRAVHVDGTEFRLTNLRRLPNFDVLRGETVGRIRDTTYMRIVPSEALSVDDALATTGLIQDLISLATHRAAGVIWVRVEVAATHPLDGDDHPLRRRADLLYRPTVRGDRTAKAVDHSRAFFTCTSFAFEEVMPRWCEARERLRAATNMVLGLRYAPASFVENNLLTAVGAAEVLHRRLRIDEKPFPAETFRAMRTAMLAEAPEEHRDRLRGMIRNDPSLRDRLCALAARPDQEAVALLVPDVDRWARMTTRARNDLAHEGMTRHHSVDDLIAVVDVTTAVVILNLLHELGLPAEQQRKIVHDHPQLRATATRARERLIAAEDAPGGEPAM